MRLETIKSILADYPDTSFIFQRNIIKEYLQILALSFIYTHKIYQNLVFYGGSSLRHCYDLPRLSEDLDFIDLGGEIKLAELGVKLKEFFAQQFDIATTARVQKYRLYLKFPLLKELGLAESGDSEQVQLKIEIFTGFDYCQDYVAEVKPLFKFGASILVKTFDLPTLMATKIRAILYRRWEQTDKQGRVLAQVKGRDYFDLMWYLEKGIKPNWSCIELGASQQEISQRLLEFVEHADARSVSHDLFGLIEDQAYVKNLAKNLRQVLRRQLKVWQ